MSNANPQKDVLMKNLVQIPAHSVDFSTFNKTNLIEAAGIPFYILVEGEAILLTTRYCRPAAVKVEGVYKEISHAEKQRLLDAAETIVAWLDLGNRDYQYVKLR
jgi:hypothetical protein